MSQRGSVWASELPVTGSPLHSKAKWTGHLIPSLNFLIRGTRSWWGDLHHSECPSGTVTMGLSRELVKEAGSWDSPRSTKTGSAFEHGP